VTCNPDLEQCFINRATRSSAVAERRRDTSCHWTIAKSLSITQWHTSVGRV